MPTIGSICVLAISPPQTRMNRMDVVNVNTAVCLITHSNERKIRAKNRLSTCSATPTGYEIPPQQYKMEAFPSVYSFFLDLGLAGKLLPELALCCRLQLHNFTDND